MGVLSSLSISGRRVGLILTLTGASLFAACAGNVSGDLTTAALGQSGDAVITMAAVMDRNREMSCMSLDLMTVDGKMPRTTGGQLASSVILGSGTIFDGASEVVGSKQIAPGTYIIMAANCKPPEGKNGKLTVMSGNPKGFATFTVAAGEVVNLGKLIIIEVQAEPAAFMKPARYVYVGHVAPLKTDPRGGLNKDLAARLIDRPMTASQEPLPQAELARICEQKRSIHASALVPPKPATCELAGI
jgi:hypothetical protein